MATYFNDSPIEKVEDDRYGVSPFAESLARSILEIKHPVGTTIALYGEWGSGKSSAVNLIRSEIEKHDDRDLIITDFKGWWFRGEEALALAFLQNLSVVLKDGIGEKAKDLVSGLAQRLLQGGPIIGQIIGAATMNPVVGPAASGATQLLRGFLDKETTVEKSFAELSTLLEKQGRRFLVIIDDIDRLNPEEAIAVFRLVKSIGRLPNVLYLLVFDRELAEKAVKERYPSEGAHFLEKVIQVGFNIPGPLQSDLNETVLSQIAEVCSLEPNHPGFVDFMNVFYDVIVPYITRPRDVVRFRNAISVTWPAIGVEVGFSDFMAMEALRLFEPGLFKAIRQHKEQLCGIQKSGDTSHNVAERIAPLLREVPERRHETAKAALARLFPRTQRIRYGSNSMARWGSERRVCIETHFDTYFRLSLSDATLPIKEIDDLILRANDRAFVRCTFRKAALTERKGRGSMVPVFLDELTTHAKRIEKEKVEPLLGALFEIHDEIDLEKDADRGFYAFASSTLRYYWLLRALTRGRFTLDERTGIYLAATEKAPLGWIVDFAYSARGDHRKSEDGQTQEEDLLVTELAANGVLTERALEAIRTSAKDGSLIKHHDLRYILYRWRDLLDGDATEVRVWTDTLMRNDEALVNLARSMTGTSWSAGMGGFGFLADRVAKGSTVAVVPDDSGILNLGDYRTGLERISEEANLDEESLTAVRIFLDAWDQRP